MAKKYYAVRVGRVPGIYSSWDECKAQTDGFPKAKFSGFDFLSEAKQYLAGIEIKSGKAEIKEAPNDLFANKTIPPIEIEEFTKEKEPPIKLPEEVTIWTDGSCFNSEEIKQRVGDTPVRAVGGYAAVFYDKTGNELLRLQGGGQLTTNNKMELTAIKEALSQLEDGTKHKVVIRTDSEYAAKTFENNWVGGYKARSTKIGDEVLWRTTKGLMVANQDILKEIDWLRQHHSVHFQHVKAHVGVKNNELCDDLAKDMSKQMMNARNTELSRRNSEKTNDNKPSMPKGVKVQRNSGNDISNGR